MKTTIFVVFISASLNCFSQVPPDSAKYHIGALTTVCGNVTRVNTIESGTTFINYGQEFTAVIFASDSSKFKKTDIKPGKKICVIGKVKEYKGKPEIILKHPNQMRFPDEQ